MDIDCFDIRIFPPKKGYFVRVKYTLVPIYGFRVIKLCNESLMNVYRFVCHILLNVLLNAAM